MEKISEERFMELYGDVKVVFQSYYKYSFSFLGEFDGKTIYIRVGGNPDDIYRFDVTSGKEYLVKEMDINYAVVKEGESVIYEFTNNL